MPSPGSGSSSTRSSSNFHLITKALSDYAKQTDIDLTQNPFADQFHNCDSAEAISELLQGRVEAFKDYRDEHCKLIKCLNPVFQFLHVFSATLGDAVPFPPAKAVFVGIDVLLQAASGVSASYDTLVQIFDRVGNFLKRLQIYAKIPFTPPMIDIIVQIMLEILSVLALTTTEIKQGRFKKFVKKVFRDNKIETVLQKMDQLIKEETSMAATLAMQGVLAINTKAEINDMLAWLSAPDPSTNHVTTREHCHDGTTTWFVQGVFEEWRSTGSLLWVHGKPGSGKSVLCSMIVEATEAVSDAESALMAYYYFDFRDTAKQDIRGLLTSLLTQLSTKSGRCGSILSDLYLRRDSGLRQPSNDDLKKCLVKMLRLPESPTIYIILDALDECPNTSGVEPPRAHVLKLVNELINLRLTNLRLCVTSRPESDIIPTLEPLASHVVSLQDQDGQKEAISNYVKFVVHSDEWMKKWRKQDKELVIDKLVRKADGMFRWVACQLEALRDCLPASLRDALRELPETLDQTYERILQGIKPRNREYAHRLLQCITVAIRPLLVEELAEVLAIRFEGGNPPEYHSDWCMEDAQEAVILACSSLISVVSVDGSRIVQFSHFSVKEFLTSDRLSQDLSRYRIFLQPAHSILSQACLCALLRLDLTVNKNSIKEFPLSIYAAQHWVEHARFENVSSSIQELMVHLFEPDRPHFATWVWIYDIDQPWDWVKHMSSEQPMQPEADALYYAALCGLHGVVEHVISRCPQDINSKRGAYGTPLHASLVKGYFEIALVLLKHGADVNALNQWGVSPLHFGSSRGRRDVVEFLLDPYTNNNIHNNCEVSMNALSGNGGLEDGRSGVLDVNSHDDDGWTPLMSSSAAGHLDIVQLLLQNGVAVNSRDNEGWTALKLASRYGHRDIVQLLLKNGATVNSRDNEGWTALKLASRYGHRDIVQLLLNNGATANSRDNKGWAPLTSASRYSHRDIVQLLLENDAAVDSRDNEGCTPLMSSSASGHLDIVLLLLQNGAAVNSCDNRDWTALMSASCNGHSDIVQLLLENGAAVDSRDNEGSTPLMEASASGHLDIVQQLLQSGAAVDSPDNKGDTPLKHASRCGHRDVVQLLLQKHAGVDSRDKKGWSPLMSASQKGHLDIVQLLLQNGAAVDSSDKEGWTSLMGVSMCGHLDIMALLIRNGATVESSDNHGWTPLRSASQFGHQDIAQLLLQNGAAMDTGDNQGFVPLHFASGGGHFDVVKALLYHDPTVDIRSVHGITPMHVASAAGELGVALFLIERGADINSRDDLGRTSLHFIAEFGHINIAQLLLDPGTNVYPPCANMWTPLHVTSTSRYSDISQFLIELRADVEAYKDRLGAVLSPPTQLDIALPQVQCRPITEFKDSDGCTPLHVAARNGHLDIVKLLVDSDADVNTRNHEEMTPLDVAFTNAKWEVVTFLAERAGMGDMYSLASTMAGMTTLNTESQNPDSDVMKLPPSSGENATFLDAERTLLFTASEEGNLDMVRSLLGRGANVNEQNHGRKDTPLHGASGEGRLEVVKLLIGHGADVNSRDRLGYTPLHSASLNGDLDVVRVLLDHDANVDAKKYDLRTPLHIAIINDNLEMVKLLLERGANFHLRDDEGRTPYQDALKHGRSDIARLLSENGAH